jgi:hypothetical protein
MASQNPTRMLTLNGVPNLRDEAMAPTISTPLLHFRTLTTNLYPLTTLSISFTICTYKNSSPNPFRICTYKTPRNCRKCLVLSLLSSALTICPQLSPASSAITKIGGEGGRYLPG